MFREPPPKETPAAEAAVAAAPPSATPPEDEGAPLVPTTQTGHMVLVGYGRVGSLVGAALKELDARFLVVEDAEKPLAALRGTGIEVIVGNAAQTEVLAAANLPGATHLFVAVPNAFEAGQVVQQARAANAALRIVARAHSDAELDHLTSLGANVVIMGEREIARSMIAELARAPAAPDPAA